MTASAAVRRKSRNGRPSPRSQILLMQATLLKDTQNLDVEPHIRAAAVRAWDVLEERLRIIDGKPLPGHLRPDLDQKRARARKGAGLLVATQPVDAPDEAPLAQVG